MTIIYFIILFFCDDKKNFKIDVSFILDGNSILLQFSGYMSVMDSVYNNILNEEKSITIEFDLHNNLDNFYV